MHRKKNFFKSHGLILVEFQCCDLQTIILKLVGYGAAAME